MSDEIKNSAQQLQTSVFLQNLVKLIPVEIVALWAIISGFIPATATALSVWIVFGALIVLVPFYIIFAMGVKKWDQVILMTIAFPIWVFAVGGIPALGLFWLESWMISVALALFTFIPPMFYGKRIEMEEQTTAAKSTKTKTITKYVPWRQIKA